VHEHGIPAYPEFLLTPSATPHGQSSAVVLAPVTQPVIDSTPV